MMRTAHVLMLLFLIFLSVLFLLTFQNRWILAQTSCDVDCLNDKITALTKRVATLEKKTGVTKSNSKTIKENFVSLSTGRVESGDWVKIAGSEFWLDLSLYGTVDEVSIQGWLEGGNAQIRIYDSTNNRVVDSSEMKVDGSTDKASFYSKPLSIWRGMNLYYLEAKGSGVTFSGVKLRVMTR